jgi:hypothetical protein
LEKYFSVELISVMICQLKTGRAPGLDGLTTEHLLNCHPAVHLVITYLCNLMLMSGHVPAQFSVGVTFPIEKSKFGIGSFAVDDFRGITISPLISKILEKSILENFKNYLVSSDNQFGFKKKLGCSDAIFSLRSTVDYFVNNNSTVNICSLDVAKAFDRTNHFGLFIKLMKKYVPVNLIMLLANWYKTSTAVVSWKGSISSSYLLSAGIRQGGVISPILFAIYIDDVIVAIQNCGLGCHIGMQSVGILMYADDLVLISGSVRDLQKMIDLCISEITSLDLKINVKKSVCLRIGNNHKTFCKNLLINGSVIPWSNQLTYLGITIKSASKFIVEFKPNRVKFYRAFNSLYGKICKANEQLIVSLMKTFCIPLTMYGLDAINLNVSALNSLDNLLYNAFGKIFKTFNHEILSSCMYYMNCQPLRFDYYNRRLNFLSKLNRSENSVTKTWFEINGKNEQSNLAKMLNVDINSRDLKRDVWNRFASTLDIVPS